MTTNTESIDQALKSFKKLPVNDQIAALAGVYKEAASSLSSTASPSKEVAELFAKVKGLREENQLQFIQDVLSEKATKQEEVALDPHPSKALLELVPGAGKPPVSQYNDLSATDRLAFWLHFAQNLGKDGVVAIPADFQPSPKVTELLSSLKSVDLEQQVQFLSQLV